MAIELHKTYKLQARITKMYDERVDKLGNLCRTVRIAVFRNGKQALIADCCVKNELLSSLRGKRVGDELLVAGEVSGVWKTQACGIPGVYMYAKFVGEPMTQTPAMAA